MSVLLVDVAGLAQHVHEQASFLDEETRQRLISKIIPYWEKEVARRTGPGYYCPLESDFAESLEVFYKHTREHLIVLTTMDQLAATGSVLDLYTPGFDLVSIQRWTPAAAKRVCGLDPRWYAEYRHLRANSEAADRELKLEARRQYLAHGGRWEFLKDGREETVPASSIAARTPSRLLNVEGAVYTSVVTREELDEVVDVIARAGEFAFDTETTALHPIDGDLVGISTACDIGRAYYIPVGHYEGEQLPMHEVMAHLKPLFEDPEIAKYGHKLSFDINFVETHSDIQVRGLGGDSKTLGWMLGYGSSGAHKRYDQIGLKQMALKELGISMMNFETTVAGRDNAADTPIDKMTPYAAADADLTLRLVKHLIKKLPPEQLGRYFNIEMPFIRTVANMERRGVYVNVSRLDELDQEYRNELTEVGEQLKAVTRDEKFSPTSPAKVSDLLFRKLRLPPSARTKTGFKTDAATLENIAHLHPVVQQILEYKQINTLITRYTSAMPSMVSPITGRIHGLISATGTETGRVSMSDPNFMNIPVRTARGAKMRYAIEGQGDCVLLDIDYSQIEPRVLAHMSEDPFLIDVFCSGIDLYRALGAEVFGCTPDEVTAQQRSVMKMCWLACTYLVGPPKLAAQMSVQLKKRVAVSEAAEILEKFYAKVSRVRDLQNYFMEFAWKNGYVETMMGHRIPIPDIRSPIPERRAHANSQAVNMPIQGTASGDILKCAMNTIDAMGEYLPQMILQVHDELIFEGPPNDLEEKAPIIQQILETVVTLRVPLVAEPAIAKTWGDAKGK